jgi:ribosomal protein L18E
MSNIFEIVSHDFWFFERFLKIQKDKRKKVKVSRINKIHHERENVLSPVRQAIIQDDQVNDQ